MKSPFRDWIPTRLLRTSSPIPFTAFDPVHLLVPPPRWTVIHSLSLRHANLNHAYLLLQSLPSAGHRLPLHPKVFWQRTRVYHWLYALRASSAHRHRLLPVCIAHLIPVFTQHQQHPFRTHLLLESCEYESCPRPPPFVSPWRYLGCHWETQLLPRLVN